MRLARRRRLDAVVLFGQKNILSLTGVDCDNGALVIAGDRIRYATDFRYVPAVRRVAPWLRVTDCHRELDGTVLRFLRETRPLRRIGFEGDVPASRYMELSRRLPAMPEGEQFKLLASDGMLVKRPILVGESFVLVGFREAEWRTLLNQGEERT